MTPVAGRLLTIAGQVFEAEVFHLPQPRGSGAMPGLPPRLLEAGFVPAGGTAHTPAAPISRRVWAHPSAEGGSPGGVGRRLVAPGRSGYSLRRRQRADPDVCFPTPFSSTPVSAA